MPLVYLSTGWLMGIWAASMLALPIEVLLLAVLVPLIGLVLWWRERRVRLIWLAALCAIFGGLRYQLSLPRFDQNSLVTYNNAGEVTIEGVIDAEPDTRDTYINLRVKADRITLPDKTVYSIEGLFLTRPSRPAEFKYGDRISVTGSLTAPPEFATFSYKDYLARQGIYSMIDRPRVSTLAHDQGSPILAAIFAFKARANEVITHILPEPQASLLTGILLGNDAGLPADVQDEFRRTGTTHIIAISGYNITILVSIMSAVTVRLVGRRRSFPILVVGLIVYTIMVGASASVVRASIMGILTLLAIYLGRQALAVNSLFVAGLIMTALDPGTLFDIGFQLSFAATLGLVVYAKPFADSTERLLMRLFPNQIARTIVNIANDAILVTFAAQVATLPLLIVYFRQFSWVSLFVNPLVLPAQTGVMVFGLLALTAGLISLPFGQIVGWLAWVFLAWTTGVIHVFASMPNAAIPMDTVDPIWPLLYYALLIGLTGYLRQPKAQRPKAIAEILAPRQLILLGGMTAVLLGVAFSWQPDNKLHIIALDVDSHPIFVRTPKGQQILIGGSNSPSALLGALGQQLPFWDHDLDLIIVPQANASQLNGLLAVLDRYRVKQIVSVKVPTDNRAGREWQAALNKYGLQAGDLQPIDVEPGIKIDFDGSVALIESNGSVISIGSSDLAQINLITTLIDRMPRNAEQVLMICETCQGTDAFAELVKDQRAIDLSNHGNVDLSIDGSDVSINVER